MEETLKKIKEMICDELRDISNNKITVSSLDTIDKLTHSLKSVETILAMKDTGYSNSYPYMRSDRYYDGRYSRDDHKSMMVDKLRAMLNEASTDKERSALRGCIDKMEG